MELEGFYFLGFYFFCPYFSTMACNTLSFSSFHYFSKYRGLYHSLHDACLPHYWSPATGKLLPNQPLFSFFFLLAKVPLLGACFIWSSNNNNNNNNNTYLHFKASEHKNGFASLSCATTWIMGCFLAGAQESQVHPYSFGPPTSPLPPPKLYWPLPNYLIIAMLNFKGFWYTCSARRAASTHLSSNN